MRLARYTYAQRGFQELRKQGLAALRLHLNDDEAVLKES